MHATKWPLSFCSVGGTERLQIYLQICFSIYINMHIFAVNNICCSHQNKFAALWKFNSNERLRSALRVPYRGYICSRRVRVRACYLANCCNHLSRPPRQPLPLCSTSPKKSLRAQGSSPQRFPSDGVEHPAVSHGRALVEVQHTWDTIIWKTSVTLTNNKCTGPPGKREVQAPYFISFCIALWLTAVFVCGELYFISNAMHAHTDNWHFKGITLDKATWTNERKRQNDLSEGGAAEIFWLTFFPCCSKWIVKTYTAPLLLAVWAVCRIAWWPEIR